MISKKDAFILKERVSAILNPDVHGENGYEVRSIYFDDPEDTCYYTNLDGTDPRSKYRVRAYDGSDKYLVIEKKIKKNGMTAKLQREISLKEMDILMSDAVTPVFMAGDTGSAAREGRVKKESKGDNDNDIFEELLVLKDIRLFRPKIVVSYKRIPFTEENGNVRITFDDAIASTTDLSGFFESDLHAREVMPEDMTLMEVKFDEFLPEYIKEALECGTLNQTSFSKYAMCRRFYL